MIADVAGGAGLGAAHRIPQVGHPEASLLVVPISAPPCLAAALMLLDPFLVRPMARDAGYTVEFAIVLLRLDVLARHAMAVDARVDSASSPPCRGSSPISLPRLPGQCPECQVVLVLGVEGEELVHPADPALASPPGWSCCCCCRRGSCAHRRAPKMNGVRSAGAAAGGRPAGACSPPLPSVAAPAARAAMQARAMIGRLRSGAAAIVGVPCGRRPRRRGTHRVRSTLRGVRSCTFPPAGPPRRRGDSAHPAPERPCHRIGA